MKTKWTHILLVEDDEDDVMLMRELLSEAEGHRFKVDWVSTYEEAENRIKENNYDLYLIDYRLNTGSGLDLLRNGVQQGCRAPMILITGQGDHDVDVEATKAGAADYLTKGNIDSYLLEHCIRYALERHQNMEALRKSEERLRRLLETTKVIPWEMDWENRKFTYVGPKAESILGYPSQEWYQSNFWNLRVHPDDLQKTIRIWNKAIDTQEEQETEFRMIDSKNQTVWLKSLFCISKGEPHETLLQGFMFDITDRKQAEEALQQKEEELRHSQKMEAIGRLAGGIAHDFNNLLTAINGFCELWLMNDHSDPTDTTILECPHEIKKAAERATALTQQLLAFSRREFAVPKRTNLNQVVREMHSMFQPVIGENVEIITELDRNLKMVKVDPTQIEQVLLNLVVNAKDAMPNGGRITISSRNFAKTSSDDVDSSLKAGHYVKLTVRDNGSGISESVQSHIFEPFFTTKDQGKGTGLGLSTVYGIIKQSKGHITVHSQINKGTTFCIYLPAHEKSNTPIQKKKTLPLSSHHEQGTILLVEDEDLVRALAKRVLENQGYHIVEASHGKEAIGIARNETNHIDLLLTDIVMPHMNGRELADELKHSHPETKVLFMSGYTDDDIARNRIVGTSASFLQKPFAPKVLTSKVRELLNNPVSS